MTSSGGSSWLSRIRPESLFEQVIASVIAAIMIALGSLAVKSLVTDKGGTTGATSTSVSAAPTPSTAPPADPKQEAELFYTLDGTEPQRVPRCNGFLSLCLSSPIERATLLLGLEEERYGDDRSTSRAWTLGDAYITVTSDNSGSITDLNVSLQDPDPAFRLSLPQGLILGRSTLNDVVTSLDREHQQRCFAGEGQILYSLIYRAGPEGSEHLEFTYIAEYGSPQDPLGFNAALFRQKVHSFGVSYGDDIESDCEFG